MLSQPIQRSLGLISVAFVLTFLNAIKPVVVDDTAYLVFADQIAQHPFDPYGFELMWSKEPAPAFETLAPPVHLCWLVLCKTILGPSPFMIKMGLLPLLVLLCVSLRSLTRSLLDRDDSFSWILIVSGSAALPMWNCMIDMPAITLGLAGLALMANKSQYKLTPWIAGLLLGLAMQTKYTACTFPAVVMLYGLLNRRYGSALLAIMVSSVVFISWELLMVAKYGESHFLYHALHQPKLSNQNSGIFDKLWIMKPMAVYLGLFLFPSALLLTDMPGRWKIRVAVLAVVLMLSICFIPNPVILKKNAYTHNIVKWFYLVVGVSVCLLYGRTVVIAMPKLKKRIDRTYWLLLGWLLIELLSCIILSPFPAARRFLMLAIVSTFISYRVYGRSLPVWYALLVLSTSLILYAVDYWDALAARTMAHSARKQIPANATRIWYQGTWGWRYYAETEGMKQIVPGTTKFQRNDWLVLCVAPDEKRFYRPMALPVKDVIGSTPVKFIAELVEDDWLRVSTIPALYGESVPMTSRHAPRFRVQIYRVLR